MPIRAIDLFCGAGGSSRGALGAGVEIVRGVDAWDLAVRTFAANFGADRALHARLRPRSDVHELLGDIGRIDLILASPECTNHTCARGSRERDEASRRTANYVLRFARELQPRWIVIENVVHMRRWEGYAPLLRRIRRLGYFVRDQVLDAQDFGVPQSRRRLFLLCDRKRLPDPVRVPRLRRLRTAADVIDWTSRWPSKPLFNGARARPTIERARRALRVLGRGTPFLIVYYGTDGAGGWQAVDRPLRTLTTLDRFGLVTWDGGTPMLRMLQVPELLRAMGFDGGFRMPVGTRRDRIRLLGNAVCAPVMRAIMRSLVRAGATRHSSDRNRTASRSGKPTGSDAIASAAGVAVAAAPAVVVGRFS